MQVLEKAISQNSNEISLLKYTGKTNSLNILFVGVTHGEEPQGKFLIENFIEKIINHNLQFKNNLYFIPCLNPDGLSKNKRGNANNVDLNRNFNTKNFEITTFDDNTISGEKPLSEIESQFLTNVVETYKFDVILSFHAPFAIVNYDGPAEDFAEKISKITGYPVQASIGYPTPGSFGTYTGVEKNIPTITLEVSDKLSNEELWEQNKGVFTYLANC